MSKSPPLEEVKLTCLDLKAFPAPIARLPGLKRVDLEANRLAGELPEGPWLDSLEELCLSWNDFAQLPSALLRCKGKLQKLDMYGERMCVEEEPSDQTNNLYLELVAAGTKVVLGHPANNTFRLACSKEAD